MQKMDLKNTKLLLYKGKQTKKVEQARKTIKNWAGENEISLRDVSNQKDIQRTLTEEGKETILLSLGGDGTFLRASDMIAPYLVPILGINLGKLGFLSGLNFSELENGLNSMLENGFSINNLTRLRCRVEPENSLESLSFTALNEVVISRGEFTGLAEVELFLDSKKVATYPGDGLIVSTPTGSTAYSLSCGGPLITRNTSAFSITPLNVHKLGLRPIICSDSTEIRIKTNSNVSIEVDGKGVGSLEKGKYVDIDKSETSTLMVLPEDRSNFFETVRNKLNWDKDRGTSC
ncbi:MAG: NAD(+)/NADH kinase [Candidatus Bipolaricaulota bacterium]